MRHAANDHATISEYVCVGDIQIMLSYDSCICEGCYRDFKRHHGTRMSPRWLRKKREYYSTPVSVVGTVFCCSNSNDMCTCNEIDRWGPSTWYGSDNDDLNTWKKYLKESEVVSCEIPIRAKLILSVEHTCDELHTLVNVGSAGDAPSRRYIRMETS